MAPNRTAAASAACADDEACADDGAGLAVAGTDKKAKASVAARVMIEAWYVV